MWEEIFGLEQSNTTPVQEVIGGVPTFMTIAYIIFVQPGHESGGSG